MMKIDKNTKHLEEITVLQLKPFEWIGKAYCHDGISWWTLKSSVFSTPGLAADAIFDIFLHENDWKKCGYECGEVKKL